jgi:hypothetical protein
MDATGKLPLGIIRSSFPLRRMNRAFTARSQAWVGISNIIVNARLNCKTGWIGATGAFPAEGPGNAPCRFRWESARKLDRILEPLPDVYAVHCSEFTEKTCGSY